MTNSTPVKLSLPRWMFSLFCRRGRGEGAGRAGRRAGKELLGRHQQSFIREALPSSGRTVSQLLPSTGNPTVKGQAAATSCRLPHQRSLLGGAPWARQGCRQSRCPAGRAGHPAAGRWTQKSTARGVRPGPSAPGGGRGQAGRHGCQFREGGVFWARAMRLMATRRTEECGCFQPIPP